MSAYFQDGRSRVCKNLLLLFLCRFQNLGGHRQQETCGKHGARMVYLERTQQALVNAHHRTGIVKLATVIGRAEQGDELPLGEELVSVFHNLMGTADQVHIVLLQEARHNIGAECKRYTTIVLTPARDVLIGVRP